MWADISAELHRLAEDVLDLVGEPAPCYVGIDIQPHNPTQVGPDTVDARAVTVAAVDAVASVLLGKVGETVRMGGNSHHHRAHGERGQIRIGIFQSVAAPDSDAELARLRAENEQLRAAARQAYVREAAPEDGALTTPGERVELGADGCGCPVTGEIRANGSDIEGTERVEHRSGCWARTES